MDRGLVHDLGFAFVVGKVGEYHRFFKFWPSKAKHGEFEGSQDVRPVTRPSSSRCGVL